MSMLQLQKDVEKLTNAAKLSDALKDVDRIIDLLSEARERVAAGEYSSPLPLLLLPTAGCAMCLGCAWGFQVIG